MLLVAATIPLSLLSTACGKPVPVVEHIPIPPDLLTCADAPRAPNLPPAVDKAAQLARDKMTLDFILALRSAHGDCKSKVQAIREYDERLR